MLIFSTLGLKLTGKVGVTLFLAQNLIAGKFQNGTGPEAKSLNPADPASVVAVYNKPYKARCNPAKSRRTHG
jgi:hypothetical protein